MSDLSAIHKNVSDNNSITNNETDFNSSVNKHEDDKGVLFQDKQPDEKLIAGYSYDEVMEKLTALHEVVGQAPPDMNKYKIFNQSVTIFPQNKCFW